VNQTLVFEPAGFDLDTIPGSGNSDVVVNVNNAVDPTVYRIRNQGSNEIDGLGISGDATSERVFINPDVTNLQASLGAGDDRLQINGAVQSSSIELGDGTNFSLINNTFTNSGLNGGAQRDTLQFRGQVSASSVDAGGGDDLVIFRDDVNGSVVNLGAGADTARFFGDLTNSILDLGAADGARDKVTIADNTANTTGLVIEGAGAEDVLFIGSSQYKYVGDYTWENIADPNDDLRFGPPA
jgi:hypothetical protein